MFDDNDGVAGIGEPVEDVQQLLDVGKCRPVVGSSRMYSVRPVATRLSSLASLTRWASPASSGGTLAQLHVVQSHILLASAACVVSGDGLPEGTRGLLYIKHVGNGLAGTGSAGSPGGVPPHSAHT